MYSRNSQSQSEHAVNGLIGLFFNGRMRRIQVSRTYLLMGDYQSALRTSIVSSADADIEALALTALGRRAEAIARLRQEEQKDTLFTHIRSWFCSLRALLEGKHSESLDAINEIIGRSAAPKPGTVSPSNSPA